MNQEVVDSNETVRIRAIKWIRELILRIYPLGFKDEALVIVKNSIPLVIL